MERQQQVQVDTGPQTGAFAQQQGDYAQTNVFHPPGDFAQPGSFPQPSTFGPQSGYTQPSTFPQNSSVPRPGVIPGLDNYDNLAPRPDYFQSQQQPIPQSADRVEWKPKPKTPPRPAIAQPLMEPLYKTQPSEPLYKAQPTVDPQEAHAVESKPVTQTHVDTSLAIGIDLGTTYSCVGVFKNGKVEILTNDFGNRTTPSCVAFTDRETLVGESANSQAAGNATGTVYEAKRLIGRRHDDPVIQDDLKQWPFAVKADELGNATVVVGERAYAPEEISAMVLKKMRTIAEAQLCQTITKAVVTVPAYFSDAQRQATKDAGKLAGLDVLRVINEPTAAAIAYGLDKTDKPESNILVFDLGGGTFDVSILNLSHGVFTVRATGGNTHLGGEDFDNNLVRHVMDKAGLTNLGPRAARRLRTACERAKRTLSSSQTVTIEEDALHDGKDLKLEITRATFEALNATLFDQCIDHVRDVLRDAHLEKSKVDEIVFVGGSTRIPKVHDMVKKYFGGKEPNRSINPDEAVAYGAAVQAAILAGHAGDTRDRCLLIDVAPLSLGLETHGGVMSVLVPRNSTIPCLKTAEFSTFKDDQDTVLVSVFEGERQLVNGNNLLGNFRLGGLPVPSKAGVPKIEVTFEVDVNGILHVSAVEKSANLRNHISIKNEKGRLTDERIAELLAEAELSKESDAKLVEDVEARNALERFLQELGQFVENQEVLKKVSGAQRAHIVKVIHDNLDWLQGGTASKETCEEQKQRIETMLNPILGKLYQQTGVVPGQQNAALAPEV